MTHFIAGVDGCRAGWVAIIQEVYRPASAILVLFRKFSDLLAYRPHLEIIAIDIPIGLPSNTGVGGRIADREARSVLGKRRSSVFSTPSRATVMCDDYTTACAVAYETSNPPRKISKQVFNIFPKIREVDALMTSKLQLRVFETHPEVAFWALNGEVPLTLAKKVKSKPYHKGLEFRRSLLKKHDYPEEILCSCEHRTLQVGPDDILDACANAWSANRIYTGLAHRFPCQPQLDSKGLRMEIWG
ncbi:MAG: DUF429 domain-containing protein [Hyphomicrobiaceae bacterium]|nr:DUF429 domain-containing protein [Hyphomicrobiaceae bacterium]